ncbi:MAG TPA: secretin N-terminal domain-containing protein [Gemmatimonadota bacterium]|jgi:type IV pilus assembly protein PilQ|nr:secretin N-terminal domain-containing protein [Gemmatimonadota bacterium]
MIDRRKLIALLVVLGGSAGPAAALAQQATTVTNFRVLSAGESTQVVIETDGAIRYRDEFQPLPPHLSIELQEAQPGLPLRQYDDIYRGGVRYAVVSQPAPDRVRFDFALSGVASYAVYQEGTNLYVTFDNPTDAFGTYVAAAGAPVAVAQPVVVTPEGGVVMRRAAEPEFAYAQAEVQEPGLPGIEGAPISLSFQNADIETVVRAFGEVSGYSIVAGAGVVDVNVTADIRDQPWDEALVTLMRANGLEVRLEGGIIRVDSVANLAETEKLVDLVTEVISLNFIASQDVVAVLEPLKSERGAVQADAKTNSLVITDVPSRVQQLVGIIRELDVQTPQVTIKAKIVFVNKVDLRELGVKWRMENLRDFTVDTHVLANTEGTIADPFLDLSIGTLASGLNVGGLLQALEQREMADIQAEPQTTVLNNLPAEIFVGERTPIRVLDIGADSPEAQATVQLIETGIILNVTPHITSNGKVLMQLRAERSGVAVNDPDVGVTFNTQRANSQILVDDGETAVIGGLTVQDVSTVRSGIPLLKDIPILGGLFRTERTRTEKRDLLIFVTPYIVPIDREESEIVTLVCLEDQSWYRGDDTIIHNGEQWIEFGAIRRIDPRDLIAVGNFRGVPIYTTVEMAASEIYLPLCAQGMYQAYRRVEAVRGTTG